MQESRSSSRRKPRRQKHWKEPALFWHVWSQPPLAARHSSTSKQQTQHRLHHANCEEKSQKFFWGFFLTELLSLYTKTKTPVFMFVFTCSNSNWNSFKINKYQSHKNVASTFYLRVKHTIAATSIWVESVPRWAVAFITPGIVSAVLLTAGALLSTFIDVCQTKQARWQKLWPNDMLSCSQRDSFMT